MVKTFFSQSDENPLNDALEEAESKCKELRKSKENLEKEIHELKIDKAKIVKNEEKLKIEVRDLMIKNEMYETWKMYETSNGAREKFFEKNSLKSA